MLELRNVCIFVLAYSGFFKVFHVRYDDIHFQTGYEAINSKRSKTDQLRKVSAVLISEGLSKDICPVMILRHYMSEVECLPVVPDHYVFRALSKCKSGHKLVSVNRLVKLF